MMQWALNYLSSSQIAVLNSQNVMSVVQKSHICKFYNEGSCSNEGNHGIYRHVCSLCSKQGHTSGDPEFKCNFCGNSEAQEVKVVTSRWEPARSTGQPARTQQDNLVKFKDSKISQINKYGHNIHQS